MLYEVIILCGGMGTRLKAVNPTLPKALVPVAGKPFLHYVINYLQQQGIQQFVFATGYGHADVEEYLKTQHSALKAKFSNETTPLGTGGAIMQALQKTTEPQVLVVNGDTIFKANILSLYAFHHKQNAVCSIAATSTQNSSRYGLLEIDELGMLKGFAEKDAAISAGVINAGMYIINQDIFSGLPLGPAFSFEKDYLEKYVQLKPIAAQVQDAYFIDMGIPSDLAKAEKDFNQ